MATSSSSSAERVIPISILGEEEKEEGNKSAEEGNDGDRKKGGEVEEDEVNKGREEMTAVKGASTNGGGGEAEISEGAAGTNGNNSQGKTREVKGQIENEAVSPKVRLVPIRLSDGTMLQRDPDAKLEIRTEFTNYCHQQFADPPSSGAATNKTSERVVPIKLEENGKDFVPTFSKLDDIELPDWSAFKNRNGKQADQVGSPKEKIVRINMEGEEGDKDRARKKRSSVEERATATTTTSSANSSRESSPVRVTKTTRRHSREKLTKSHEKRVQHTVRFADSEDSGERVESPATNKRSASLDGRKTKQQIPLQSSLKKGSSTRERHRSGPGQSSSNNNTTTTTRPRRQKGL